MLRGAVTGTLLGALPGIGSTAAAFISYALTKAAARDSDSFGKGNIKGIAAAESAKSSVVGATLIPLLTLGSPGSVGAALIVSAFMIHGVQPGPRLEVSIAQSLALTRGDPVALLDHPVAIALLILSVVAAVYLARRTGHTNG